MAKLVRSMSITGGSWAITDATLRPTTFEERAELVKLALHGVDHKYGATFVKDHAYEARMREWAALHINLYTPIAA